MENLKRIVEPFLVPSVKGKRQSYLALNEVVIHSGSIAQLIEFDLMMLIVLLFIGRKQMV